MPYNLQCVSADVHGKEGKIFLKKQLATYYCYLLKQKI